MTTHPHWTEITDLPAFLRLDTPERLTAWQAGRDAWAPPPARPIAQSYLPRNVTPEALAILADREAKIVAHKKTKKEGKARNGTWLPGSIWDLRRARWYHPQLEAEKKAKADAKVRAVRLATRRTKAKAKKAKAAGLSPQQRAWITRRAREANA